MSSFHFETLANISLFLTMIYLLNNIFIGSRIFYKKDQKPEDQILIYLLVAPNMWKPNNFTYLEIFLPCMTYSNNEQQTQNEHASQDIFIF